MAEGKKSFVLYADLIATVSKLTDQKAGKLFKTILEYVNDKNPELDDILLQIAFEPIKQQLKRDLKDWEATRSKRVEAGKLGGIKSGESRRSRSKRSNASKNEANEAVNVNDTVNVNVNVIENMPPILPIEQCLEIALKDSRWVKANRASRPELTDFNAVLEKRGEYEKVPSDYKQHFSNWKSKGKVEETVSVKTKMVL